MTAERLSSSGLSFAPSEGVANNLFFQNIDFHEFVQIIRRRHQLIAGVTLALAAQGLLIALLLTPQYRAESVIMLDARKTQVVNMDSIVAGLPADNSALRSEIDIMTSRAVIDRVIKKLNLTDDSEFNDKHLSWLRWLNPVKWFSPSLSDEEIAARERTKVAQEIAERLRVDNDGRSLSIRISFESKDPMKAATITNTFADEYLVDQLEAKYEIVARANSWLNDRLTTLKQQLEASEKAAEDFRQHANLIEVDGATMAARQMEEVNTQLVTARNAVAEAEARMHNTQEMLNTGGVDAAADVLASPLIQKLREQEAEVRRNEADLATRYGDRHPKMIHARADLHDLESKIAEEVQKIVRGYANEVDIAKAKEEELEKQLVNLQGSAGGQLKDVVTLRQLEREAAANRTLYESFLTRFKQTAEQQDLQLADSRIIARAETPLKPSFPLKSQFMAVGAILGLMLGVLIAFLMEYFDRGFRGMPQLEAQLGLPAVGLIPSLVGTTEQAPEEYVIQKPLSSYSEALRTVRTAIRFSNVDNPPKTVLVTSSLPDEGKTTFCMSLGRSLAKAGNKILLIDADLRRSHLAKMFNANDTKNSNLASLLAGETTFANTVEHDPSMPGLDFIAARGVVANAQDLLGSHQMQKMLQDAAKVYDLVIVDSPPILAVSDAAMIAPYVDTTLFLVRWGTTPRDTAIQAVKQLKLLNCKIAGVVLTQVDLTEHTKYNASGYGYNYEQYREYYSN